METKNSQSFFADLFAANPKLPAISWLAKNLGPGFAFANSSNGGFRRVVLANFGGLIYYEDSFGGTFYAQKTNLEKIF